jgi:hypothetical protein
MNIRRFRRVILGQQRQGIDHDSYGPRLRYGQIKKKGLAKCGALFFFVILLRTATTFQCELLTGDQRRSGYLPLVSTFCFSSSFIFLIVGSGLASPVV